MAGRQRSEQALRNKLRSPGRPGVGMREHRRRFWAFIAAGLSSEDAAMGVGGAPRHSVHGSSARASSQSRRTSVSAGSERDIAAPWPAQVCMRAASPAASAAARTGTMMARCTG